MSAIRDTVLELGKKGSLTVDQIAEQASCKPATVRQYLSQEGLLRGIKKPPIRSSWVGNGLSPLNSKGRYLTLSQDNRGWSTSCWDQNERSWLWVDEGTSQSLVGAIKEANTLARTIDDVVERAKDEPYYHETTEEEPTTSSTGPP